MLEVCSSAELSSASASEATPDRSFPFSVPRKPGLHGRSRDTSPTLLSPVPVEHKDKGDAIPVSVCEICCFFMILIFSRSF